MASFVFLRFTPKNKRCHNFLRTYRSFSPGTKAKYSPSIASSIIIFCVLASELFLSEIWQSPNVAFQRTQARARSYVSCSISISEIKNSRAFLDKYVQAITRSHARSGVGINVVVIVFSYKLK